MVHRSINSTYHRLFNDCSLSVRGCMGRYPTDIHFSLQNQIDRDQTPHQVNPIHQQVQVVLVAIATHA